MICLNSIYELHYDFHSHGNGNHIIFNKSVKCYMMQTKEIASSTMLKLF